MPLLRVVSRLAGGRASSSNGVVVVVWLTLVLGCIFRHHLMAQTGDSGKGNYRKTTGRVCGILVDLHGRAVADGDVTY